MTPIHSLILAALILIPLVGATLLVLGWRGRRVDDLPYCRGCGFALRGLETGDQAKCPECGRGLGGERAVRVGRRVKRPALLIAGSFLLLAAMAGGGVLGWGAATSFNWNTIKPVWWLESDARGGSAATAGAAFVEFSSRLNAGELTDEQAREVVRLALAYQADFSRAWSPDAGDFVGAARLKSLVTDQEWIGYHRAGVSVSGRLRPRVQVGAPIPWEVVVTGPRMGSNSGLWLLVQDQYLRLEDKTELAHSEGGASMGFSGGGVGTVRGTFEAEFAVGRHGLFHIVDVALSDQAGGEPLHSWTLEYQCFLDVVDGATSFTPDQATASVDAAVRAAISVESLRVAEVEDGVARLYMQMKVTSLPVDVAFQIFARIGEGEVEVGRTTFESTTGQHISSMTIDVPGFEGERLTLVLRADVEAAERTVEMVEIWEGEIVLEDLAVEWPEGLRPPPP